MQAQAPPHSVALHHNVGTAGTMYLWYMAKFPCVRSPPQGPCAKSSIYFGLKVVRILVLWGGGGGGNVAMYLLFRYMDP